MTGLQKLNSCVNYAIGFRLQFFTAHSLGGLETSYNTNRLIALHDDTTRKLKIALRRDYHNHRARILAARLASTGQ